MTIKQLGGVFGRNPTFNNVTIEGTLTFDGDIDINSDLTIGGNLDVTGTVTADGLTVNGITSFTQKAVFGNNKELRWIDSGGTERTTLVLDSSNDLNLGTSAGGNLKFYNGSTYAERMRIDASGNVGIGTTSIAGGTKLQVAGETRIYPDSGAGVLRFGSGGAEKGKLSVDASSNMAFETAGSERMRIDASGNVGIGVTPSSLWSGNDALQLNTYSSIAGGSSFTGLSSNLAATSSGWAVKYIQNGRGLTYLQDIAGGTHRWYYAASGTAGNVATINEAMRIDASGHAIIPAGVTLGTATGVYAAANTLDDYEEGTWTPTLEGAVSAGSYSVAIEDSSCKYTKVGRQVTVTGRFTFTVSSAGSSYAKIGGLPFATSATNAMAGAVRTKGIGLAAGTVSLCTLNPTSGSVSYFAIGQSIDNANSVLLDIAGISSTDQITVTLTYFV